MPRVRGFAGGAFINFEPGAQAPDFSGPIPDISKTQDTGTHTFELGAYFAGADSYAIDPAVETGWTFDTNTGQLVIDTDGVGVFGPFTVTATNTNGDTPSNAFSVTVVRKSGGGAGPFLAYGWPWHTWKVH
jgi:hypothetical protein